MSDGTTGEDKTVRDLAMVTHLLGFAGMVLPFGNIIGPLVIWLMKREESQYIDIHGKEVLNFQISMLIWFTISGVLALVIVGFVIMAVLAILSVIWTIMGAIRASAGEFYRYPITIRFIK